MATDLKNDKLAKIHSLEEKLKSLRDDQRSIERLINEYHERLRGESWNSRLIGKIEKTDKHLEDVEDEIRKTKMEIDRLKQESNTP